MKLTTKIFLCCEVCQKEAPSPNGGDYNLEEFPAEELIPYLLSEAMDFFWIRLQVGSEDVLTCTSKCAAKFLKDFETRGN